MSDPYIFDCLKKLADACYAFQAVVNQLEDGDPPWDDALYTLRAAKRYVAIAEVDLAAARTHYAAGRATASYQSDRDQSPLLPPGGQNYNGAPTTKADSEIQASPPAN